MYAVYTKMKMKSFTLFCATSSGEKRKWLENGWKRVKRLEEISSSSSLT